MLRRFRFCLFLVIFTIVVPYKCIGEIDISSIRRNYDNNVETALTDNIRIAADLEWTDLEPTSLFTYSREVYNDIDDKIRPEHFPQNKVVSIDDYEKEKYGTIVYYMENDAMLALLYGNTVRYRTHNGNNYYQLWLLENETIKALPCKELSFMSMEQAKEVVLRFLKEYNIMSPCVQEIYSVDQRQLEELTAHMTYVAPEVSEYFTEVLMEHEVYYITLGHSFDEIPTVEQSSDLICISSEGISCIEISRVGGDYRKEARIEHILPIEDALTIFLEDQKEILQERIIDKISFAYFSEAQIDNYIYYSPQWIIHSYYTPATLYKADKKIALGETCLINADTGKLGYLDATEMLQIE